MAKLNEQLDYLKENQWLDIHVLGHTDSIGREAYNLALSKGRARSVRDYLVAKGISPQRVDIEGYGDSKPLASKLIPKGRAVNRRVDIRIVE